MQIKKCMQKKIRTTLTLLLSCVLLGGCAGKEETAGNVAGEQKKDYLVVEDDKRYKELLFEVEETLDVVYGQAVNDKDETEELKLDVYQPAEEGELSRPAVLFVHGGSFTTGDKASEGIVKSMAKELAQMGYVTFNMNYRLSKKTSKKAIESTMEDITAAINWIQLNSAEYGVDGSRIALAGYSAGAIAVTDLYYSNLKEYEFDRSSIVGVIDIAGVNLHFGSPQEGNAPCLILHGTKDTTDDFAESEKLVKLLQKKEIPVTLYPLEGMNHNLAVRYDELRNQTAMFLYQELTGNAVEINLVSEFSIEYQKVQQRMQNGIKFVVKPVNVTLDGKLDEWTGLEEIPLNQLKDAGEALPEQNDFNGTVMVGWNPETPTCIYLAAKIEDDTLQNKNPADGKWYNDDCLEIVFDTSHDGTDEQLLKWVIGAENQELSVLATAENTQVSVQRDGSFSTYEVIMDLAKIDAGTLKDADIFPFSPQSVLGMSVAYNDGEDGERQHQIGWTAGKSSDRSTLANLIFE